MTNIGHMAVAVLASRDLSYRRRLFFGKLARNVLTTRRAQDPIRDAGQPDLTGDWHEYRVQRGAGKHQDIFFPQDAGVSVPQCGRLWAERGHDGSCYGASARPQSPTGASLAWATCFQSESPFKGALATRMQDNDIQSFSLFLRIPGCLPSGLLSASP